MTLNLAFFQRGTEHFDRAMGRLTGRLRAAVGTKAIWREASAGDSDRLSLPPPSRALLGSLASSARELQADLLLDWMQHLTGRGLGPCPTISASLSRTDWIECRERALLRFASQGRRLLVSANGHGTMLAAAPSLDRMLTRIRTGRVVQVSSLLEQVTRGGTGARRRRSSGSSGPSAGEARHALALLQLLQTWQAIRLADPVNTNVD